MGDDHHMEWPLSPSRSEEGLHFSLWPLKPWHHQYPLFLQAQVLLSVVFRGNSSYRNRQVNQFLSQQTDVPKIQPHSVHWHTQSPIDAALAEQFGHRLRLHTRPKK